MVVSPPTIPIQLGQTVKLDCSAGGYPIPTIAWSRDGHEELPISSRKRPNGSLIIESLKKEDRGQYVCVAKNSLGMKSHSVILQLSENCKILILAF